MRVDGLAVTPEGSPAIETEMVPLKELSEVAVTVMALLVVPALSVSEPGDTAREKSGAGFGGALPPQVVSREMAVREARSPSALGRVRIYLRSLSTAECTSTRDMGVSLRCHSFLRMKPFPVWCRLD